LIPTHLFSADLKQSPRRYFYELEIEPADRFSNTKIDPSCFPDHFARKDLSNFPTKAEVDWGKMEILFQFFRVHYETKFAILNNIHCLKISGALDLFLQN
jgi:hypothetical protein